MLGIRVGDNAEKAMIELVDFNEIYGKGKGEAAAPAKKTRRAGSTKKSPSATVTEDKKVEAKADEAVAPAAEEKSAE